jgi:protein involved in polysaccharide export with SLBB domain
MLASNRGVMKHFFHLLHSFKQLQIALVLLSMMFAIAPRAFSQGDSDRVHTTGGVSRAEVEAERLVSLSADKIITILQQETGLLLQVKRLIVQKAYEQGRLLDPQDLTDDALFRLIRQDENTRILITREIEDRNYVRAKPSRAELERDRQVGIASPVSQPEFTGGRSQEEAYWTLRDRGRERGKELPGLNSVPAQSPDSQQPPQQSAPADSRRQLERARAEADSGDFNTGLPMDVIGMSQVTPDQMPGLLSTSLNDRSKVGTGMGASGSFASAIPPNNLPTKPLDETTSTPDVPQSSTTHPQVTPPRPSASDISKSQPVLQRRPNPYADVPSLYDLYSQYSRRSPVLERFGMEVFHNGTGNVNDLPMDMPVGPDYVLGPGDGVSIDVWGGVSERLRRVVDREGRLALPEVGSVQVAGRSLGEVQRLVQTAMRSQFRDVEADVSLSRLRTVRVYVVGDVQRPGAYDVSSLSTPLNAFYEAGGPTSQGSLRILKHYRANQLVEEVDVYDLLLHGIRSGMERLQPGDTILVPPLRAEVSIEGMVRRPAIYELHNEKNLAEVLELAGGVLASGTLRHVDVERVQSHESRTMLRLDVPESNNEESVTKALLAFDIQDGDKVKISPIVPHAEKTVYLDGHVIRPGKYAYQEGMKVSDLIKSYKDVLPEPYKKHAEIIRLNAPDYTPTVLAFNLEDALAGKDQDIALKPMDTIRVFGRFDFEDPPVVTVTGEVRDPGDHVTNGATYLRDAIYLAGNVTPEAELGDAQIYRRTDDGNLHVISVNLNAALAGDAKENVLLESKDRVFVHRSLAKADPSTVSIQGEVARPGKYQLGKDMSSADLIKLAGGLKRSAYSQEADLTSYRVENGKRLVSEHRTVPIAKALANEPDTDVRLHDGDVLTIRRLPGWDDIGATITVNGEVVHPGTYGIREGERLSSVLARAGGLRAGAYPYGAILERIQVRQLEERNRAQLIRRVQEEGGGIKDADGADAIAKQSALLQWKSAVARLENTPPAGRVVIHISGDVKKWTDTPADIQVRDGDQIFIPKTPNFVMVDGAVYNPTAIAFKAGKSADWYLRQAGGPTTMANKKAIFIVRADGTVRGGSGGLLFGNGARDSVLQAGDMVVVPDRAIGGGLNWKNTLQVAQLVSAVGIAVQVARGF